MTLVRDLKMMLQVPAIKEAYVQQERLFLDREARRSVCYILVFVLLTLLL